MVEALDLSCNMIGDEGAAALIDALECHPLRSLSLFRNRLRAPAALASACLFYSALVTLRLHGNSLGDDGATAFAGALEQNPALTELELDSNGVRDAGASALARALRVNTRLRALNIGGLSHVASTPTDAGATALAAALLANDSLTCLWLEGSRVRDAGVASLCDALRVNCTLRACSVLPDKVALDDVLGADPEEREAGVYLQRLVDARLRAHVRYADPYVRWLLRTRALYNAGRARPLRARRARARSVSLWLCTSAPLWVVVRVCELLRPARPPLRAWYDGDDDSGSDSGSGDGDSDDEDGGEGGGSDDDDGGESGEGGSGSDDG